MEEYPPEDLAHLQPAAQALARLPDPERRQRIRADRWIGYPRAVAALARLETLYEWPTTQRMPNLLLIGPTNNGKSMIIEKFRRQHPPSSGLDEEQIPVLTLQMPSDPSVIRFYMALLTAIGAPLRPRQRLADLEQLALALLRRVGVRMLVVDELHNMLAGRDSGSRREFLNLLRFLGNELRIPLIGVGTREAYLAIHSDAQLENRFEPVTLPLWVEGQETASLLASFAASFPLRSHLGHRHPGHHSLPARPQRGHHRRTDPVADRGRRGGRGQRSGGHQPPHPVLGRVYRSQRTAPAVRARTLVKPPARWPLHPAPLEGEALSSWLRRIAASYRMSVRDLLEHDLGHGQVPENDLDVDPPSTLLAILARRSGLAPHRLRQMSLAGWTPWLLDSLAPEPAGFDTYVRQFSVLLKPGKRSKRAASPSWLPWISGDPIQRACPHCLDDPTRQGLLLMWQLPLLLSCPDHDCMLEPCIGFPGPYLDWTGAGTPPRTVSDEVKVMDHRTQQALRTGRVELPRRQVHAGVWFRLLRTLLYELSTPATYWGPHALDLRLIWACCGHPVRAGQRPWRPFEALPWPIQTQLLEAVAGTIDLLETGALDGQGTHAELFFPTPPVEVDAGRPTSMEQPKKEQPNHWELAMAALKEAVQAARDNPADAQHLYNLLVFGCRTPESVQRLRANFIAVGIPPEHLSYNQPPIPLA